MSELKFSSWLFIRSEKSPDLWTTGFYDPNGKWIADCDHTTQENAAARVAYLNGDGTYHPMFKPIEIAVGEYTPAQIVTFLQKVYCLELSGFTEFLTWVNDGNTPASSYIEPKYERVRKDPGMALCLFDPERAEKFLDWILAR